MEWSGKAARRILPLLLALLLLLSSEKGRVPAAEGDPFRDPVVFYECFGANRMVPRGETLYFCTRGKRAAGSEITYRTLGYTVRVKSETAVYVTEAAVGESIRLAGDRTRTEEGLPIEYVLYAFDGSMLFKRLKLACPEDDFRWFFQQGRKNTLLADAVMTIARNGRPLGSVRENDAGGLEEEGLLFRDEASIRAAAAWDSSNDFSSEFNILVTMTMESLFPPVLVRTVDRAFLPRLPEQSLWKKGRPYELLEQSLGRSVPKTEIRVSAGERREGAVP